MLESVMQQSEQFSFWILITILALALISLGAGRAAFNKSLYIEQRIFWVLIQIFFSLTIPVYALMHEKKKGIVITILSLFIAVLGLLIVHYHYFGLGPDIQ